MISGWGDTTHSLRSGHHDQDDDNHDHDSYDDHNHDSYDYG